jgi:predicted DNA-binding WGR domain protein
VSECEHAQQSNRYWVCYEKREQRNDKVCVDCGRNLTPGAPAGSPWGDERPGPEIRQKDMRRFECTKYGSNKFWEVMRNGSVRVVRYGPIGTEGRLLQKDEGSTIRAQLEIDKLVKSKLRKGYVEVKGDTFMSGLGPAARAATKSVRELRKAFDSVRATRPAPPKPKPKPEPLPPGVAPKITSVFKRRRP